MKVALDDRLLSRHVCPQLGPHHWPAGWLLILLGALTTLTLAAPNDPHDPPSVALCYRSGVRNSADKHRLSAKQLAQVLESLRAKTGFLDMSFDEDGFLSLGDRSSEGGSASARMLLIAAVDGDRAIVLESHNHSSQVVFARTNRSTIYQSYTTGERMESQPIEIDFSDFGKLRGRKEVLAAFDLGFVLLHELGHCALHLHDVENSPTELGECEGYINYIRRELGLPERRNYVARQRHSILSSEQGGNQRVELTFFRHVDKEGQATEEPLSLSWEINRVGAMPIFKGAASKDRATSAGQE